MTKRSSNPRKRAKRNYENKEKVRAGLGLASESAYNEWRASPDYAKTWWDTFEKGYLQTKIFVPGSKGVEFAQVYQQVKRGEANGAGRYSKPSAEKKYSTALDWQAWLLCNLVQQNTLYRDGCFFGKGSSEIENYRAMWDFIKCELRQRSRNAKSTAQHKSTKTGSTTSPNKQLDMSSSEEEALLDPTSGLALVYWNNAPLSVIEEGGPTTTIVRNFCGYEYSSFVVKVAEQLKLQEQKYQVSSLDMEEGMEFHNAQLKASKKGQIRAYLTTEETTIEVATQQLPDPLIRAPEILQDPDEETENRSLAYSTMVTEAREVGADRMNMGVRLWQFNMMYIMSKTEANVNMNEVVLRLTDEEGIDHAIQYNHDLRQLNKKLSNQIDDREQDISEDTVPPPTNYQAITAEEMAEYRKQTEWLNNSLYQRQDHEEACRFLGIEEPDHPRIEGMRLSFELEFYQPTAIKAMVDFENSNTSSGLLADDPGLGKTLEMIGLLLYRSNERRRRLRQNQPVDLAKPTLILMPIGLVTQWKDEIVKFTDRFLVVIYYGTATKNQQEVGVIYHKGKLSRKSTYFDTSNEQNFDTIILSTYSTWATRHGPSAQKRFRIEKHKASGMTHTEAKSYVEENYDSHSIDMDWDGQLQGTMLRVMIDEGHEIRHMPKQVGTTIQWLQAQYRDVITGTPTLNGLDEFSGIMAFMQDPDINNYEFLTSLGFENVATENPLDDVLSDFDPWSVDDKDPRGQLKFCSQALKQHVFIPGLFAAEQGARMVRVLSKIMIRRSFASTIGGKRIGDSLPEVQRLTIECDYTPQERQHYEAAYMDTSNRLMRKTKDQANVVWSTTTYRKMCLLSSWLGFAYLLHYKAPQLKDFRRKKGTATTILKDLRAGQKRARVPDEKCIRVPPKEDIQSTLEAHCKGSPKLRALLGLLAEIVVLEKEKAIIWCNTPAQMEWLHCVLRLCGLDVHQLRADLTGKERDELMNDFRGKPDETMVLICSWMISCAGLNMQDNCRTIIEFEPAPSEGVRQQGIGRVRRKGAKKWCRHICLRNANSFNTQQAAMSLLKSLPALLTQLNLEMWGNDEDSADEDRILGDYVKHNGRLYPAKDPAVANLSLPPLDPDTLLLHIQQTLLGQELEGDIFSLRMATRPTRYDDVAPDLEPLWA